MSKYNDFITDIITQYGQHRKNLSNPDGVIYERHHIKPRCIGGTDDIYNLIDLTLREHYIAHKLLAEEYPDNEKLVCAWHFMSVIKQGRYEATPEEYEASRLAIIKAQGEAVYQIDEDGEIVGCYHSVREAGRQVGISYTHIVECCNKDRHSAKGFYWQTVKDYEKNGFQHKSYMYGRNPKRKVNQYTLDGEYVTTYNSITEAGQVFGKDGGSIGCCCRGKTKTAYGFIWKYAD